MRRGCARAPHDYGPQVRNRLRERARLQRGRISRGAALARARARRASRGDRQRRRRARAGVARGRADARGDRRRRRPAMPRRSSRASRASCGRSTISACRRWWSRPGFGQRGLPIGLQLIGRPFGDETLVALGIAFQARDRPSPPGCRQLAMTPDRRDPGPARALQGRAHRACAQRRRHHARAGRGARPARRIRLGQERDACARCCACCRRSRSEITGTIRRRRRGRAGARRGRRSRTCAAASCR